VARIDGEPGHTDQLLVWPGVAERGPAGERLAAGDDEVPQFGPGVAGGDDRQAEHQE
jgi:hypothetical protein